LSIGVPSQLQPRHVGIAEKNAQGIPCAYLAENPFKKSEKRKISIGVKPDRRRRRLHCKLQPSD
jgi:hypothetical protein